MKLKKIFLISFAVNFEFKVNFFFFIREKKVKEKNGKKREFLCIVVWLGGPWGWRKAECDFVKVHVLIP